ncbi:MAG: cytochrome P450 [Gammaproteobacteria bacterium]|nr:cytochrome P450 [Gammaproteobacteria bacterium]
MKHSLSITEEFILMILNDETGYFYQVGGWDLNCAVIGSVLADLSLQSYIDTDADSLFIVNAEKTGEQTLDLLLDEIRQDKQRRNTQYWIERLATHSETIIDQTLARLVKAKLLKYHDGGFYTINKAVLYVDSSNNDDWPEQFVKQRISETLFTNIIPDPRDIIIISLLNVCDVLRFIFELDDDTEKRIHQICQMELISRSIAEAVTQSIITPAFKKAPIKKKIPSVHLLGLMGNRFLWRGNIPALMAEVSKKHGPVFHLHMPNGKSILCIAGPNVNRWVHRNARKVMTSGVYFRGLEKVCGASGLITSLDGADHFRLRKVMGSVYSEKKFFSRLGDIIRLTRSFMSEQGWKKGTELSVQQDMRMLINLQMTNILVSTDSQDIFNDLVKWKEGASNTYVGGLFPKWWMKTPAMKRRFNILLQFIKRIEQNHTPFQRAGKQRELADDLISMHHSDPQFMPEQNLPFLLGAAPILQSIYLGDVLGFAIYEMSKNPDIVQRLRNEANALFKGRDPDIEDFTPESTDACERFVLECLRLYPVVPLQIRTISNQCMLEDYALPTGQQVYIIQTAAHYSEECFPDPHKFDIDRYLPERAEHRSHGYSPYGLGTHMCVGFNWMKLQLIVSILLISHHYDFATLPKTHKLQFNPFPTLSVSKKLKLKIADQVCELPT